MNRIVVDAGSTKIQWGLISLHGERVIIESPGWNPMLNRAFPLIENNDLMNALKQASDVFYYGAGVNTRTTSLVADFLTSVTNPNCQIELGSDLLGAARALFLDAPGIACILGTGSNFGIYNGKSITETPPSLGYLVMDEGSGNKIGSEILRRYFRKQLPPDQSSLFEERYDLDVTDVISQLYTNPQPNTYLARFAEFALESKEHILKATVKRELARFVELLIPLRKMNDLPIGFVGGVASSAETVLGNLCHDLLHKKPRIIKQPIKSLCEYHLKH